MTVPFLEARGIRKQFPGVLALDDVTCAVHAGEVLAVVGENGAGKSTLMKVMSGVYQPDAGTLHLNGSVVRFPNPLAAMAAGVSLIHQELNLAENLPVLDNLYLGRECTVAGALRWNDQHTMRERGAVLMERVGLPTNFLNRLVGDLAPGQKQLVEIARALGLDAKLLIFDEPTSSLTQKETDQLYKVIDSLKTNGVAMMYISHRLAEIKRCCDRAIVLRDGRNAGELPDKTSLTHDNIVKLMVGRDLKSYFPRQCRDGLGEDSLGGRGSRRAETNGSPGGSPSQTGTVLKLNEVRFAGGPSTPVTLELRAGEVLGLGGLVGAGRTELAEAIFGLRRITHGTLELLGTPVKLPTAGAAVKAGVLLLPEDRRLNGLVLEESVGFNISLPILDHLARRLLIDGRNERRIHNEQIDSLRIKTPSAKQTVGLLSGGNQQKVVLGKWLARGPKVLILDEPTRGVDVGAKTEIYTIIDELAGRGVAVLMISSDMEELLGVSDRIGVMHEGRLAGILDRTEANEEAVMTLATGGSR
jgi:ribose transport system ATP-binding protein